MSDVNYKVTTELTLTGQKAHAAGLKASAAAANELHAALGKLGSGVWGLAGGAFSALERTVGGIGTAASVAFGVFAYAGSKAVAAIGKDMAGLEASALQLGAVIGAATGKGFAQGQREAGVLFEQFGKDAMKSAGERGDFVGVAKAISGPVIGVTGSLDELRKMTGRVIGAATVVGETFEESGRDTMAILSGVAGNDVKLFRTLKSMGLIKKEAKEFNQQSPAKRFEELNAALGNQALIDSQEAFGESWAGLSSSVTDGTKALGRLAGSPVFGFLKTQLKGLSVVLQEQADGGRLYDSFERLGASVFAALLPLRDAFEDLFPDAVGSASGFVGAVETVVVGGLRMLTRAVRFTASHWDEIRDAVDRTGAALGRAATKGEAFVTAVGGGDFGKGAERLGGAFLGVKGAQALGLPEMAGAGAMTLSGAAGTARALGMFGGGAAAAGGGAAAAGAAGAVGAGEAAGVASAGGAAAAGGGLTAAAVLSVGAALAAVGSVFVAFEQDTLGVGTLMRAEFGGLIDGAKEIRKELGPLGDAMAHLWSAAQPIVGLFGAIVSYATPVGIAFHAVAIAFPLFEVVISKVAWAAGTATEALAKVIETLEDMVGIKRKLAPVDESEAEAADRARRDGMTFGTTSGSINQGARALVDVAKSAGKKANEPQKVEVTVKLDLGTDNDAIYVRTARDIKAAFDRANSNPQVFRLRT
jgi:hypothetical protein